ncbi:tRNA (guanine(10)-N2)-methyltransferase -like protein [Trichinella nativa]|uniref:40S ribosomal protein S8 n=1 Tax=Trichinella nativa TaxID=6335 RepID=A0A0V1LTR6_9BILA|nr:tRNA (guanine(10)-N2)-methyltransferase -like protein [Trichinella nativa]
MACRNKNAIIQFGSKMLVQLLNEIVRDWKINRKNKINIEYAIADIWRRYGIANLISPDIIPDEQNVSINRLAFNEIDLKFFHTSAILSKRTKQAIANTCLSMMKNILKNLINDAMNMSLILPEIFVNSKLAAIIDFEFNLFKVSSSFKNTPYNKSTIIKDLKIKDLLKMNFSFNWADYFLGLRIPSLSNSTFQILLINSGYFIYMDKILKSTPNSTIIAYLLWILVLNRIEFLDDNEHLSGLDLIIGSLYANNILINRIKNECEQYVNTLVDTYLERVDRIKWLNKRKKAELVEKIKKLSFQIAYSKLILNQTWIDHHYEELIDGPLKISTTDPFFTMHSKITAWKMNNLVSSLTETVDIPLSPLSADAYYSISKNRIQIGGANLRPPFFNINLPKAVNYGSFGIIVAHEIGHAFDSVGTMYDSNGIHKSNYSEKFFDNQQQCLIEQYNKFCYTSAESWETFCVDGEMTKNENFADNIGLSISFHAYRKHATNFDDNKTLPWLKQFSDEQIFFISFAQSFCLIPFNDNALHYAFLADEHAPYFVRILGSLMNNPQFSEIFHCPVGSKMNPSKKMKLIDRCLLCFAHHYTQFREATSFCIVESISMDDVLKLLSRSILLRYGCILWSQASTYSELYKDLSSKIHLLEPYFDREQSFKFLVDSFGKKVSGEYKQKRIEELSFLNIQGKVDLTNPDNQFMLIEDYGKLSGLPPPENPVQIFFGRLTQIKFGMNKVVSRYNLKDRIFIGNTSMDPILSFLMANIGEVQSGDLVLDPYVGSGSILLPAAHFGGYCVGVEIDYNVLHGKSKPSRCTAIARHPDECIRANFKQYGLEAKYVDVLVADSSKSSIWTSHARFDCILTDPPYGIREKGAKVKRKQLPDFWLLKDRSTETVHYPSKAKYCLNDLVLDLLNFAATCLTEGGHLVYWLPVCKNQFDEAQIPKHPCLKIVSTSLQLLTKTYGRVLISMVKIREPSDYIEPETSKWEFLVIIGIKEGRLVLGSKRIHIVRVRGGNRKYRALRLETGNYSWGSEGCTRKTRIIDVVYNASNNELVRTKTLVKSAIVVIDATPFRQWYENHYALPIGRKKGAKLTEQEEAIFNATRSKAAEKKLAKRRITAKVEPALEEQFQSGRLLACITSRPGQVGRADGYVLEGKELEFYLRKIKAKKSK